MADIRISDMMEMQKELFEKNKNQWSPMQAEYGRNFILWMVEELGEAISIIKKKGDTAIMQQPAVRAAFVEELGDVLMYYTETLLRYGVSAQEISDAYLEKHQKNMGRDYAGEYSQKYKDENQE